MALNNSTRTQVVKGGTGKTAQNRGWWDQKGGANPPAVTVVSDEVITARGIYPTLGGRLDTLEDGVGDVTAEVVAARNAFPSLDARLDDLTTSVVNVIVEITAARGAFPNLNARLDDMTFEKTYNADVGTGTHVMLEMTAKNQEPTPAGSVLYGIRITTDTTAVDTAAAFAVVNDGNSDGMYIDNRGKTTANSTPTGIGIDMNKGAVSGQRSSSHKGLAIQVYDHSTTDIGVDGPHFIYLWKKGNLNTQHPMIETLGNRNAMRMIVDPTAGGFDAQGTLWAILRSDSGVTRTQFNASGDLVFIEDTRAVRWTMASGNEAKIAKDHTNNRIDITMPTGGMRFVNNGFTAVVMDITNAGAVSIRAQTPAASPAFVVEGAAEIRSLAINNGAADGGNVDLYSQGFQTMTLDNNSGTFRIYSSGGTHIQATNTSNVIVCVGSLATAATSGFFWIPTMAGAATGLISGITGHVPLHYDTTNNRLRIYNAGWKSVLFS